MVCRKLTGRKEPWLIDGDVRRTKCEGNARSAASTDVVECDVVGHDAQGSGKRMATLWSEMWSSALDRSVGRSEDEGTRNSGESSRHRPCHVG